MRRWAIAVSASCLVAAAAAWAAEKATPPPLKDVPKDMRAYYVVFLVAGPRFAPDSPERAALLLDHLAFIRKMISEKKLRLAGPFADDGKLFGIAIVDAPSGEQARAWLEQDPAVKGGFFAYEMHPAMLPSLDSLRVRY